MKKNTEITLDPIDVGIVNIGIIREISKFAGAQARKSLKSWKAQDI